MAPSLDVNSRATKLQYSILTYNSYLINTILFLTIMGFGITQPAILQQFQYYLKIYIGLFLVYRFNAFVSHEYTELDRKVAFSSGVILLSAILTETITEYVGKIRTTFLS
jgi:hypothetical protein